MLKVILINQHQGLLSFCKM